MRAALCACLTSEGQPTPPLALMPLIALISPSPGVVSSSRSRGGNGRAYAQLALRIRALMLRRPRENFYRVARPRSADQPFLPKNQRQNRFHQPDASHSLPMCGMNALRARCGFFWQSSKVLTRLAATPRTLCRPTHVLFVDCPARCWLGPRQPARNRSLRLRMPNRSSVSFGDPSSKPKRNANRCHRQSL